MDPVTQGTLGAVFAQIPAQKHQLAKAATIGAIAGMAPDLDILIRSSANPLLALEFHRHFTHSLFFIPIGGLLCSLLLHPLLGKRWGLKFSQTLLWCIIGFATHGLLDGCTTYGTQLLWPLTNQRYEWDIISVIDPLFTLPLLFLIYLAMKTKKKHYVAWAITWGAIYLSLGYIQHSRAEAIGYKVAKERGHQPTRLEAKPSFANLAVWKIIYEDNGNFHIDAVKPGIKNPVIWEGQSIKKLDIKRDYPWLSTKSQQAKDIKLFDWFASGYTAVDPHSPNQVIDIRFSMLPQQITPLWGIELSPAANESEHVDYIHNKNNPRGTFRQLIKMIFE